MPWRILVKITTRLWKIKVKLEVVKIEAVLFYLSTIKWEGIYVNLLLQSLFKFKSIASLTEQLNN